MNTLLIIILCLLAVVVFVLAIYLGVLLSKLKNQTVKKADLEKLQANAESEQTKFFTESLEIIAKATLQQQCELSEACIRIKKILEYFPEIEANPRLVVIQEMYVDLDDFAYLDERKKLSKQDKFQQDTKRFKVEQTYEKRMHEALDELVSILKAKH